MLDRTGRQPPGRVAGQVWQQVGILWVVGLEACSLPLAVLSACSNNLHMVNLRHFQSLTLHACRWCMIAKKISKRTGQQCAQRWRHRVSFGKIAPLCTPQISTAAHVWHQCCVTTVRFATCALATTVRQRACIQPDLLA